MLFREARKAAARETKSLTPGIIRTTQGASANAVSYGGLLKPLASKQRTSTTRVSVENCDTLTKAQQLLTASPRAKVGVLNMASEANPGGGWLRGSLAQEEALCLRSTLAVTLNPSFYPIATLGALWSPGVVVFRGEVADNCLQYEKEDRFIVGVVSVAGLRHPKLSIDEKDYCLPKDVEAMENKIRQMLRVLATNGTTHCVLGALGCGVFGNPTRRVSIMFRKIILEEEFKGRFDEIVFAVLDSRNEGNFEVFHEVLDELVVP